MHLISCDSQTQAKSISISSSFTDPATSRVTEPATAAAPTTRLRGELDSEPAEEEADEDEEPAEEEEEALLPPLRFSSIFIMFSSTVPLSTSLKICTVRFWPIR